MSAPPPPNAPQQLDGADRAAAAPAGDEAGGAAAAAAPPPASTTTTTTTPPAASGKLCILLHGSIPFLQQRLPRILPRLQQLGVHVAEQQQRQQTQAATLPQHHDAEQHQQKQQQQQQRRRRHATAARAEQPPAAAIACTHITHVVLQPPEDGRMLPWAAPAPAPGHPVRGGNTSSSCSGSDGDGDGGRGRPRRRGSDGTYLRAAGGSRSSSSSRSSPPPASTQGLQHLLKQVAAYSQQSGRPQPQLVSAAWLDALLASGAAPGPDHHARYSLDHLLQLPPASAAGGAAAAAAAGNPSSPAAAVAAAASGPGALMGAINAAMAAAAAGGSMAKALRLLPALLNLPDAPMGRFAPWLGRWGPELDGAATQVELMLHARYPGAPAAAAAAASGGAASGSGARGALGPNEAVRAALKELEGYELAVGGGGPVHRGAGGESMNYEALNYAHAAAAVRGCSFPLSASMHPEVLQQLLPFCGASISRTIAQLLATGTSTTLERFRNNQPVVNSGGDVRGHTAGARVRAMFVRLPGVGGKQAAAWYQAGCASFQDVLARVQQQQLQAAGSAAAAAESEVGSEDEDSATTAALAAAEAAAVASTAPVPSPPAAAVAAGSSAAAAAAAASLSPLLAVSKEALHSLAHAKELLQPVSPADVAEMRAVLLDALVAVSPGADSGGWRLQLVGGGRRGSSEHDADFLVTHPRAQLEGLVLRLHQHLVAAGRVVPRAQGGFVRLQQGRMPGYKARARNDILAKRWITRHQMDWYDHLYSLFVTTDGRRRRFDVIIISPPAMWPYALLGWTGSKQWLRFLRQHASNCGLSMNSHGLFRAVSTTPLPSPPAQHNQEQQQQPEAAAPGTHAGPPEDAVASSSLAATLAYVRSSVAARVSAVVLSVPDEAPPVDHSRREFWPPGWAPAGGGQAPPTGSSSQTADGSDDADQQQLETRQALAALVQAGVGTARPVLTEADLCQLLGVPFVEPHERCC